MPITNLAAWRAQRQQSITLPSGLPVTLRKVALADIAASGKIPDTLAGQVDALMSAADDAGGTLDVKALAGFGGVVDLVVRAALISPPLSDTPDGEHLSLSEIPFTDKIEIFSWAQQEVAQVAAFPGTEPDASGSTPRGRQRVRTATE